jgi:hypothetical protein
MSTTYYPSTTQLRDAFTDEVRSLGGRVSDTYEDDARLLMRAVLPAVRDVGAGDTIQAGVAMRVAGPQLGVHPYTFRQVCTNGAIAAYALDTHRVQLVEFETATEFVEAALGELRLAVRKAAEPDVFRTTVDRMRTASTLHADQMINLIPVLSRVPRQFRAGVLRMIGERFAHDGDPTMFGIVNAVTSVARDTADPDIRWKLEEAGGLLLAHGPWTPSRPRIVAEELTTV